MAYTDIPRSVLRQAAVELNLLRVLDILPVALAGARLDRPSVVHDLNGEPLFARVPLRRGQAGLGWADIALHPDLGGPLLAVSAGLAWEPDRLRRAAAAALRKPRRAPRFDELRFVAYSYPKVAVQALRKGAEVGMVELFTWTPVPPLRQRRARYKEAEPPGNFERWSLLESLPPARRRRNARRLEERSRVVERRLARVMPRFTRPVVLERYATPDWLRRLLFGETRELHYTTRDTDHSVCYELRGQETNVWCVAASVQMVLDFYRYEYAQTRIADELGLGTPSNPNGLPYSRDGDVVTVLQDLSSDALVAAMNISPAWSEFVSEIRANRPLVSFIPGHSRTVAGFTRSGILLTTTFRGLLVYDPWPPNAGVITRWENFDTATYRRTFTAHVTLA